VFGVKNQGIGNRVWGIGRKISYCKIKGKAGWEKFYDFGIFFVRPLRKRLIICSWFVVGSSLFVVGCL
jgi:hypothetical protein